MFKIEGYDPTYFVGKSGFIFIGAPVCGFSLAGLDQVMAAINHPDRIIKISKWAPQEVEDAKTIQRMFGKDNFTHVQKDEDGWPSLMDGDGKDPNVGRCSICMEKDMFPSLGVGQTVTLEEIVNEQ